MKQIQEDVGYIDKIGVDSNNVAIDANNVGFITSLLTTKLYSKPLHAFFREIISNGYDAQIESGTDEPLIITLQTKKNNIINVSIRDFGTGISPERFNEIFLFLGSSTKRESNDYIGQLGIGRFASLAVSDVVHMTSYYNNKIYYYAMYRTDSNICIDKIYEEDSKCKNGFEVEVDINSCIYSEYDIYNAINQLAFFDKIYVNDINVNQYKANEFNTRKNFRQGNLYALSNIVTYGYGSPAKILYGNVLYDMGDDAKRLMRTNFGTDCINCALCFDIGELDINPNRESLLYNERTINAIDKKIKQFHQFVSDNLIGTKMEFDNLYEALREHEGSRYHITLGKIDDTNIVATIDKNAFTNRNVDLFVNNIILDEEFLNWFEDNQSEYIFDPSCIIHEIYGGKFRSHISGTYQNKLSLYQLKRIVRSSNVRDISVMFIDKPLNIIEKKWMREQHDGYYTIWFIDKDILKDTIFNLLKSNRNIAKHIIKLIRIFQSYDFKHFDPSSIPQYFIDSNKKQSSKKCSYASNTSDQVVRVIERISCYGNPIYSEQKMSFDEVCSYKGTIVYSEYGDCLLTEVFSAIKRYTDHVLFVTVRKNLIQDISQFKNTISCSDLLYTYNNIMKKYALKVFSFTNDPWLYNKERGKYDIVDRKGIYFLYNESIPDSISSSLNKYKYLKKEIDLVKDRLDYINSKCNIFCNMSSNYTAILYILYKFGIISLSSKDLKLIKQDLNKILNGN